MLKNSKLKNLGLEFSPFLRYFSNFEFRISNLSKSRGFSLIEMMVSVSIFIMVMVVAAGAILSISSANKKSQTTKIAVDNLGFVLESMSRHIRVGTDYSCGESINTNAICSSGTTAFSFNFSDPASPGSEYKITYRKGTNSIEAKYDDASYSPLTGSDITIDSLTFYVVGSSSSDEIQPRVIISAKGFAGGGDTKNKTEFNLHTSVTQRLLDF